MVEAAQSPFNDAGAGDVGPRAHEHPAAHAVIDVDLQGADVVGILDLKGDRGAPNQLGLRAGCRRASMKTARRQAQSSSI